MATEIKLPDLGENIESADVLNVLVKPGDSIEKEQSLIEIETDKATIEVPSNVSGTIKDVLIKEGDNIKVGQAIITMENSEDKSRKKEESKEKKETDKEETSEKEDKTDKKKTKEESGKTDKEKEEKKDNGEKDNDAKKEKNNEKIEEKAVPSDEKEENEKNVVELKLPDLGENIESADVLSVLVKEGDQIEKDQGIMEIETDKATIEVPSNITGKVVEVLIKEGENAKVGQPIFKIESGEGAVKKEKQEKRKQVEEKPETSEKQEKIEQEAEEEKEIATGARSVFQPGEIDEQPPIMKDAAPAAPSVRRIAREIGVDIKQVRGSGPGGRISMDDVKSYSKKLNEGRTSAAAISVKKEELPDFSKFGEVERKDMSNIRSKTAVHLSYAWATIPHVTQHDKADITELEQVRKNLNPQIEKAGGKLTVTAILLKVLSSALRVFPQFNSSIDLEKKQVIYKKYFNIGVAVDTEHGLIVPVLRDVDKKNIKELSIEMGELAEKARSRKVSPDDLQGACITITNLGGIGGTLFTPIVNSPEVAILGVSRGSFEPVYKDGEFIPRLMLPLSLSYDHRIIDGADAARFLRWVCEALEQPVKILVEG